MNPSRVIVCMIGFAALGSLLGVFAQRGYLALIGPAGVAHLPPGNSRALYRLGEFCLGGLMSGGLAGLAYGVYEQRPPKNGAT